MARVKLKQVLSNLHYDASNDQLILSGSFLPSSSLGPEKEVPDFVIYGATYVTASAFSTGSITIADIDTFGDSGSFDTLDLGDY